MRRAPAAHGGHEQQLGQADAEWPEWPEWPDWPDWPDWYAAYLVAQQSGTQLPVRRQAPGYSPPGATEVPLPPSPPETAGASASAAPAAPAAPAVPRSA